MKNRNKGLIALSLAGVLAAGVGFVGAQTDTDTDTGTTPSVTEVEPQGRGVGGRGHGLGFGGRGLGGHLALGTTVTYTFYDGDPAAGGGVTDTLSLTYGEDSESAFAETLQEARADAAFVVVQTSEQTRTVDLSDLDTTNLRGKGLGFLERGLNDGSTVTATFYDGDPEADGSVLETLSFTDGQDSAAGFAAEVEAALEDASFVTVTTSPQERTIDLSQQSDGRGDGFNRRGPGRGGFGPGRGNSGLDNSGQGSAGQGNLGADNSL